MILTNGCCVLMELVWSYIVTYCSHLNSGNGCVHGSTLGTVETVVFMVVHWEQWKRLFSRYFIHWEQWKRLCSWYYIGNSGNEMCSWYNIGKSGKDCFHGTISIGNSGNGCPHDTPLGTSDTIVLMELHSEQWKRLCSWNYIGNSGNEMCSWYYIGNSGNGCPHGTTLGTVETIVFTELHSEQWKRLCSFNYIGNSGNDCAHGTTFGTVQ